MVPLLGLSFPQTITFYCALLSVPGIGRAYANYLILLLGFTQSTQLSSLSRDQLKLVTRSAAAHRIVGATLERQISLNIFTKVQLKTYQGSRHLSGLPVRGQNTKTNASTAARLRAKLKQF